MMKSRGEALPAAEGVRIPRAVLQWFSDPVWLGGLLCETLGYVLYFAALAYAPVSLVAVMMQGGIAAFVLVAIMFLHEGASRAEAAGIAGLVLLQNSFHWARGIIAMPLSSAVSNLVPIIGGIVAFGESLPSNRIAAVLRAAAFTLTVISGVLLAKGET